MMRAAILIAALTILAHSQIAFAQNASASNGNANTGSTHISSRDSVVKAAGERYAASAFARAFLGNTYRELWTTPIKVPVLNLATYAGGLRPVKRGGGLQTTTLRLADKEGREYIFRGIDKDRVSTPPGYAGTFVDRIFRDQVSALHPAGAMVSAPILKAGTTLHPTPVFFYMPDDPLLGEFRQEFAGKLGMIEEYPNVPSDAPGFGGALEIIDSEDLLKLLNKDPMQRVDARAMLKARLIDILLSDNDRHAGQWKWARMSDVKPAHWVPIPRDRDHAFIHFDGILVRLARTAAAPHLILFEGSDVNLAGLTEHRGFDARMLAELDRAAWDSVTNELVGAISDSIIDAAVLMQPAEYRAAAPGVAAALKQRRDSLPLAAAEWYSGMATSPEIHATDAVDRAFVSRAGEGVVVVRLESENGRKYFERKFDSRETQEIRIYLHGGDDLAVLSGNVDKSILVRIVGGNGSNTLADSSLVRGKQRFTRLYDEGDVDGVSYGEDTLFNRKAMIKVQGKLQPPGPDRGVRWVPTIGLGRSAILGSTPLLRYTRYDYGFRRHPYANMLRLEAEYASRFGGWRVSLDGDRRSDTSPIHFIATARMSDFEVISYRGPGNMLTLDQASSSFYEARQRQWMLRPAVALALTAESDISIGPVVQYSSTDSVPNRFISEVMPYGFGDFRQVGARVNLHLNFPAGLRPAIEREGVRTVFPLPLHRFQLDVEATHFPAAWDVKSAFQSISARAGASITLPLPTDPLLVMRGGAKALFGDFPFHEAAYIGGRNAARLIGTQSFEGDASLYGSAEFRVKAASFLFVLPLQGGPMISADAARVFVNGSSPGGWHAAAGGGLWVGLRDSPVVLTFTAMNDGGHTRYSMHSGLTIR